MTATQACHNCRRQRLKCDRSLPQCLKCTRRGQECLGYQRLLRWAQGVASRGKMAGKTFTEATNGVTTQGRLPSQLPFPDSLSNTQQSRESTAISLRSSPTDPLLQDVNQLARKYLHYFASDVCKDLVLYDSPKHNPFRELIPMTHQHPILLQIIVANSALHMSNTCQKSLRLTSATLAPRPRKTLLDSTYLSSSAIHQSKSYSHALAAKQQALHLLQSALASMSSMNVDVTLAVVLLFIEFELIDSGRDNWKPHINGARTIINQLCVPSISTQKPMSPLRSCLISNCLVFDILGSTLAFSMGLMPSDTISTGALSLLLDEEGNHCSSFPVSLLQLVRAGAQLLQFDQPSLPRGSSGHFMRQQAADLLHSAQSFDPLAWAANIQRLSPVTDLQCRMHVASAHRAAVCIYLSRILFSLDPARRISANLELLVTEIITHLSLIRSSDPLFTAITWPTFIAGAETNDRTRQDWVTRRFQELWEVEPWGLMQGALEVLERIWAARRSGMVTEGDETLQAWRGADWIGELRRMGTDWLII